MDRPFGANPPLAADIDHRRAHSDTFDDILLFDPSDIDLSALDLPIPSGAQMAVDCSDDSAFSDNLIHAPAAGEAEISSSSVSEVEAMVEFDGMKKGDKLSELALTDPKRAKRILLNRQSAARSKERTNRYASELESKVYALQAAAATLSAQITMLQSGTFGLTAENKQLKMQLQALEKQAQLREALHETLMEEVQRLRTVSVNGSSFNSGLPQFNTHHQQTQQFQQQLIHASQPSNNNHTLDMQAQTQQFEQQQHEPSYSNQTPNMKPRTKQFQWQPLHAPPAIQQQSGPKHAASRSIIGLEQEGIGLKQYTSKKLR